jgi:hypothetical protein
VGITRGGKKPPKRIRENPYFKRTLEHKSKAGKKKQGGTKILWD